MARATAVIRPATPDDVPGCARLGARLSRAHHRLDPERFLDVPDLEAGYAWWLAKERRNRKAVVLAAVAPALRRGAARGAAGREVVVGYAYGRLEPRDWTTLREACGVGVDIIVEPRWRGRGLGKALVEALAAAFARRRAPRLVIQVASENPAAQAAFATMGFRPTMLEMTRELPRAKRATRRRRAPTRG